MNLGKGIIIRSVVVGSLPFTATACGPVAADPPGGPTPCAFEGQQVPADEIVRGERIGDVLEPYFGQYVGLFRYSSGGATEFRLTLTLRDGEPFRLSNIGKCEANAVYCYATAHITTVDGLFDHVTSATLHDKLSAAPSGALPRRVVSITGLDVRRWTQLELKKNFELDPNRYENSHLIFEVDWTSQSVPTSGRLIFAGYIQGTDLYDRVVVASLEF